MWRIKTLTEHFGMCGVGWKYEIDNMQTLDGANGEIAAFVTIKLFIMVDGEWSHAIYGTGGSMLVEKEKEGLHTSDECFKMALTDALSVACKALGVGSDIYWQAQTKYDKDIPPTPTTKSPTSGEFVCSSCGVSITENIHKYSTEKLGKALCFKCQK
jgi:hypothetical protein